MGQAVSQSDEIFVTKRSEQPSRSDCMKRTADVTEDGCHTVCNPIPSSHWGKQTLHSVIAANSCHANCLDGTQVLRDMYTYFGEETAKLADALFLC
jgi:hypothetical protein